MHRKLLITMLILSLVLGHALAPQPSQAATITGALLECAGKVATIIEP